MGVRVLYTNIQKTEKFSKTMVCKKLRQLSSPVVIHCNQLTTLSIPVGTIKTNSSLPDATIEEYCSCFAVKLAESSRAPLADTVFVKPAIQIKTFNNMGQIPAPDRMAGGGGKKVPIWPPWKGFICILLCSVKPVNHIQHSLYTIAPAKYEC